MAQPVTYKPPRRINVVSVTVVVMLAVAAWSGYEWIRVAFLRQEAFRMLEETSSTVSGRRGMYRNNPKELDLLRRRMESQIVGVGVDDPDLETWIEIEGTKANFGVVFSASYHWPMDVLEPIVREIQIEHVIDLPE